ncbi:MAG: methyltransferase domain-containing protein [Chloroflexota bacterium]
MSQKMLFDEWPERYDQWFTAPIGRLVKETETDLIRDLLDLKPREKLLDAGCGTGIFTLDFLAAGAEVVGLDISLPMLTRANTKLTSFPFLAVRGNMLCLPFRDNCFDKAVSVTALEFIEDANRAVSELLRVTRPGGYVVVATLNSLSPWTARRKAKTGKHLLENAFFRSPDEVLACSTVKGAVRTCVYFQQNDEPGQAVKIELSGQSQRLNTGAFVAARWQKPL